MILALVLAGAACLAAAVAVAPAAVVIAVQHEDRRMSLKAGPATGLEAAIRRFLGVGVRQPKDSSRTFPAGRR